MQSLVWTACSAAPLFRWRWDDKETNLDDDAWHLYAFVESCSIHKRYSGNDLFVSFSLSLTFIFCDTFSNQFISQYWVLLAFKFTRILYSYITSFIGAQHSVKTVKLRWMRGGWQVLRILFICEEKPFLQRFCSGKVSCCWSSNGNSSILRTVLNDVWAAIWRP